MPKRKDPDYGASDRFLQALLAAAPGMVTHRYLALVTWGKPLEEINQFTYSSMAQLLRARGIKVENVCRQGFRLVLPPENRPDLEAFEAQAQKATWS